MFHLCFNRLNIDVPKSMLFYTLIFTSPFCSLNTYLGILFLQVKLKIRVMLPPAATAQSANLLTVSAQTMLHVFIMLPDLIAAIYDGFRGALKDRK
jgi:hypothetical protein